MTHYRDDLVDVTYYCTLVARLALFSKSIIFSKKRGSANANFYKHSWRFSYFQCKNNNLKKRISLKIWHFIFRINLYQTCYLATVTDVCVKVSVVEDMKISFVLTMQGKVSSWANTPRLWSVSEWAWTCYSSTCVQMNSRTGIRMYFIFSKNANVMDGNHQRDYIWQKTVHHNWADELPLLLFYQVHQGLCKAFSQALEKTYPCCDPDSSVYVRSLLPPLLFQAYCLILSVFLCNMYLGESFTGSLRIGTRNQRNRKTPNVPGTTVIRNHGLRETTILRKRLLGIHTIPNGLTSQSGRF